MELLLTMLVMVLLVPLAFVQQSSLARTIRDNFTRSRSRRSQGQS
ncbi:MAG: hypothetical protein AAF525_03985 [Pseudomonadota bacterium]